jgi:hypothetical protein
MGSRPFGLHGHVFDALLLLDAYLGRRRVNRVLGGVRAWNDASMVRRAAPSAGRDPLADCRVEVAEVTGCDVATFKDGFQRRGRPVVLRGLAAGWPALRCWSLDMFDARLGAAPVVTVDGRNRGTQDEESGLAEVRTTTMPLVRQLASARSGGPDYLCFDSDLFEADPGLLDDLDIAMLRPFLEPLTFARRPPTRLFIGGAGTSTQWHADALQTTFVQVSGTKEWFFCPPGHTACLDGRVPMLRQQYAHSMVDFRNPDLRAHPLYAATPVARAVLHAGDVLYVLPFWWHCVRNPELSIGVSIWWYSVLRPLRVHPVLFWLTALSPQHAAHGALARLRGIRRAGGHHLSIYGRHDPSRSAAVVPSVD